MSSIAATFPCLYNCTVGSVIQTDSYCSIYVQQLYRQGKVTAIDDISSLGGTENLSTEMSVCITVLWVQLYRQTATAVYRKKYPR